MIGNCQLRSTTTRQRNKIAARTRERVKGKTRGRSEPKGWVKPFPQPANPDQRYSPDTPWLAIVNARGPSGLWMHHKQAPDWQPWCAGLFDPKTKAAKSKWFQQQSLEAQFFIFALWRLAAILSVEGIIWGESESLRRQMHMPNGKIIQDRVKFNEYLEAYAQAGFICYLSDAEKEAAERLIFTKQRGQDRIGEDSTEENSTATGSGIVVSENTSPDCTATTGQKSENTEQQSESHSTTEATGTSQDQHHAQSQQPVNPQKPEAAGLASRRGPERPRIDAPRRPAHSPSAGLIAGTPPNRTRAGVVPDEPSLLADSLHPWRDDLLSLSFGCEMHNELHKGSCLFPGTREQRSQWPTEVWSDVSCWAKLCFEHIRGRPDALEMCQRLLGYAREQVKYHKSARKLAAVTMSIAKKALGIAGHPARAGP
jgi:hypothetical protein